MTEPTGTLTLHATLTAAPVDAPEPRVAEAIVVPYGVPGRTSAGLKRIKPGALRIVAEAPVIGLYGHRMPGVEPRGVSRLIEHDDRPEGLFGRLRIAQTQLGDELLAEIRGGVREGVSVELSEVAYDPADPDLVVSARLDAIAHVPLPAYDSARVSALAASLNTPTGDTSVTDTALAPADAPAAPAAPAAFDYAQLAAALAPHLTAGTAPAGLPTGALAAAPAPVAQVAEPDPLARLASLQAAVSSPDTETRELRAALADITNSDLPLFQRPDGAIPQQLWANVGYSRRFVPLLTGRPLTSYTFGGWEFTQKPEVGDWTGDKTEVPTGEVATREITGTAARIAGGWDVDRKFRDFGDAAFWAAFYAAQTESYARLTDAKAAAAIVASAQDVTSTAPVTGYTRPSGFGTVVDQDGVLKAVAFGTAYLEETPLIEQGPDYVLMNTSDYMSLLDVAQLDAPEFLNLFGVAPGSFIRTNKVPAGAIVLGVRRALEWYELPGAAPIRVEALDVARGGVDSAVFGYWGTLHVRPGGIISVPLAAGA
jgi:HK97 family phage prohead protease